MERMNKRKRMTPNKEDYLKCIYEIINKYIDQKLAEKDSQKDLVKENEADKD